MDVEVPDGSAVPTAKSHNCHLTTGILKTDKSSHRRSSDASVDFRIELEHSHLKASPQHSLDHSSVSFAIDQASAAAFSSQERLLDSPGLNNFNDLDDEEYSTSAAAILQRLNANKKGLGRSMSRRGSSPYNSPPAAATMTAEPPSRHGIFSIMHSDNAEMPQPINDPDSVPTDRITLHKEVIQNTRYQPWDIGHKLRVLRRAKAYVRRHEGALQQRLAEGRTARDLFAQGHLQIAKLLKRGSREFRNLVNLLVPWEYRIKEIESHFGSAVASYFTFLRWVFWINVVISVIFAAFVIIPEVLTTDWNEPGERKGLLPHEEPTATDLETLWDFEGVLKYSPIFYGFYSNRDQTNQGYRLPFAYFMTGMAIYIYSFVAILRKMAHNSRLSKLSDKEDECTFTWKLFTGWDFMIGHAETAANRLASITLGFKEALLEEKEKLKQQERPSRRIIAKRCLANFCVLILLAFSAYAVVLVVERSSEPEADSSWWRQNETTVVLSLISIIYPNFFELLGLLEHYHPRRQLRWQLARIMVLNMLNLYTLILALFGKIDIMTERLTELKLNVSATRQEMLVTEVPLVVSGNMTLASWTENETIPSFLENATQLNTFLDDFSNYTEWVSVYQDLYDNATTWDVGDSVANNPCVQVLVDCKTKMSELVTSLTNSSALGIFVGLNFTSLTTPDPVSSRKSARNEPKSFHSQTTELYNELEAKLKFLAKVKYTSHLNLIRQFFGPNSTNEANYNPRSYDKGLMELSQTLTQIIQGLQRNGTIDSKSLPVELNQHSFELHEQYEYYEYNDTELAGMDQSAVINQPNLPTPIKGHMCYVHVCDGQTSNNETTREKTSNTKMEPPCRGDNPQGCTDYWTGSRGQDISFAASLTSQGPTESHTKLYQATTTRVVTTPPLDEKIRIELRRLCWETMFGQELVKLTIMDLVFTVAFILIVDFIRAVLVRILNPCWCWDLEKYFPQYGEFKIAENILHLVNNQGMIWMGMFFSPGLPLINIAKLTILLYVRSWAVLTCNIPHETIFRASRSNNFYLWLLLMMLFLCTLPVAYAIVWLEPSWHCGPFSDYSRMFHILTQSLFNFLPASLHWILGYISSPGVVIPLLVLLILVIYYLASLSASLREAATDLRFQLRHERNEERRKNRQKIAGNQIENAAKGPQPEYTKGRTTFSENVETQWRSAVLRQPTVKSAGQMAVVRSRMSNEEPEPKLLPINGDRYPSLSRSQMDGDASELDVSESLLPVDSAATPATAKVTPDDVQPVATSTAGLQNESRHVVPRVAASQSVTFAAEDGKSADIPQINIIAFDVPTPPGVPPTSSPLSVKSKPQKKTGVGALNSILQQVKQRRSEHFSSSTAAVHPTCHNILDEPKVFDTKRHDLQGS